MDTEGFRTQYAVRFQAGRHKDHRVVWWQNPLGP